MKRDFNIQVKKTIVIDGNYHKGKILLKGEIGKANYVEEINMYVCWFDSLRNDICNFPVMLEPEDIELIPRV